jgi:CheY-like chemotaxis protein/HPt (histidine-containing phosphotransfer) domain-containing protein
VEDIAERYAPIAQSKNLELLCKTPLPPLSVVGDSARLGQIITNLLSNAIKFTEAGEVQIGIELIAERDDMVQLEVGVRDTGIGISPGQQARLFQSFTQADSSMARKYGGTGLGLTISQRLTQMMGGEIGLQSGVGKGSYFHFRLDLQKVNDPRDYQLVSGFGQLRTLVVDDNPTNREILDYWLRSWGMAPVMASSAPEALALLQQQVQQGMPFELMLTDWCMPEMDAGQLLDAIAADASLNSLAIIVLSSAGLAARPEVARRAPLLLKPVRQSELHNLIAQVIAGDLTHKFHSTQKFHSEDPLIGETTDSLLMGRVLLAEDNPVNQEVASVMLQKLGLDMRVASNGREATGLLQLESFDLVLMDCQMPIMDGFEATASIREREAELGLPEMPIIALTANAISGDREHCLALGMSDYLSKPFSQTQLYEVLARWLPQRPAQEHIPEPAAPVKAVASIAEVRKSDQVTSGSPVEIDEQVINQLRELREGLLPRIIELFRASSPALIVQMETAVAQQDSDLLYKTAHNFKNSAANLGLVELAAACRDCEAKARQGNLEYAGQQLHSIKTLYGLSLQGLVGLEQGEQCE